MANKGIVRQCNYSFNAAAKTITFDPVEFAGLALSDVMYITNIKSGVATVVYDPSDSAKGATLAGNVLTLNYDTSSMSNSDPLQIIIGSSQLSTSITNDDFAMFFRKMMRLMENPIWINAAGRQRVDVENFTASTLSVVGTVNSVTNVSASNLTNVGSPSMEAGLALSAPALRSSWALNVRSCIS